MCSFKFFSNFKSDTQENSKKFYSYIDLTLEFCNFKIFSCKTKMQIITICYYKNNSKRYGKQIWKKKLSKEKAFLHRFKMQHCSLEVTIPYHQRLPLGDQLKSTKVGLTHKTLEYPYQKQLWLLSPLDIFSHLPQQEPPPFSFCVPPPARALSTNSIFHKVSICRIQKH